MPDFAFDGSVAQVTRVLRELIELTGEAAQEVPVLELQLGDILTRTTVQASDGHYLVITALLPRRRGAGFAAQASEALAQQAAQGIEYLWHADEGRHIGVRRVPIAELTDERSLMDAILATSDQAAAWFASKRISRPAA